MTPLAIALGAWESVRAYPTRAALATVSVVLGVLALTLVSSLGSASEEAIRRTIARSAGRPATLQATISGVGPVWEDPVLQGHLDEARRGGAFIAASPLRRRGVDVRSSADTVSADALAVEPSLADMRAFDVTAGRWLREGDGRSYAPAAVLNTALIDALSVDGKGAISDPRAFALHLDQRVGMRVVGIVDDAAGHPALYVHQASLERWSRPQPDSHTTLLFRVDPERWEERADVLGRSLRLAFPGSEVRFSRVDNADSLASVITTVGSLLTAMGIVALVVGSLGTLNLGLVTVRERARELGLRRAFGASSRDVFWIVLTESVLTNLAAGVVGVLLAVPLTAVAPRFLQLPVAGAQVSGAFPAGAAAVGMAAALGAGLLGGWVPARRATRLNVIDAIRS